METGAGKKPLILSLVTLKRTNRYQKKIKSTSESEKLPSSDVCVTSAFEFGLFDFALHHTFEPGKANQVLDTLKQ